jgi:hypothetical protein
MFKTELTYKGFVLTPLAASDAGSFAAMLIIETPGESQHASGVLGNFPTQEEACRYVGMAEIDQLAGSVQLAASNEQSTGR